LYEGEIYEMRVKVRGDEGYFNALGYKQIELYTSISSGIPPDTDLQLI
jgi:hypothetical protein